MVLKLLLTLYFLKVRPEGIVLFTAISLLFLVFKNNQGIQ